MGRLNLHIHHNTKYETVANIRDNQTANLWRNYYVYHKNFPVPKKCGQMLQVADVQGRPNPLVLLYKATITTNLKDLRTPDDNNSKKTSRSTHSIYLLQLKKPPQNLQTHRRYNKDR